MARPLVVHITGDTRDFKRAIRRAEGDLRGFGKRAGRLGKGIAKGVGVGTAAAAAGLAFLGAEGLRTFASLDKGVREVATLIPDATEETVSQMREQIQSVSTEFGVPGEEAAKAFYDGLSAGVAQSDIQGFTEQAAKFATAGVTSIGAATDLLTSTVNAYGLEASDAAAVSDTFFATVKAGKTTVEEISMGFAQFGPLAAAMGVSLEEANGWLAHLTKQGVPTRQAATMMKAALAELGKETSMASKAFSEASGQTFPEFIAAGGDLQGALKILDEHAAANNTAVQNLFGSIEAGQGVLSVTGDQAEGFADTLGAVRDSAGATDDAFDIMAGGAAFAFAKLQAQFEEFKAEIGRVVLPIAEMLLPVLKQLIDTLLPHLQRMVGHLGDIFAELLPALMPVIDALLTTLAPILTRLAPLFGKIARLVAGLITPAMRILAPIVDILTAALDAVLIALDGLIPIIVDLADFITLILLPPLQLLSGILEGVVGMIPGVGGATVTVKTETAPGEGHPGGVDAEINPPDIPLGPMDEAVAWVVERIRGLVDWFNHATRVIRVRWDELWEHLLHAGRTISHRWDEVWAVISRTAEIAWFTIQAIWNVAVPVFQAIWNAIKWAAQTMWNTLTIVASGAWSGIQAVWRVAVPVFQAIWNAIKWAAQTMWNTLTIVASGAWNAIKAVWENGPQWFSNIWNGIKTAAETVWNAIRTAVSSTWRFIWNNLGPAKWASLWSSVIGAVGAGLSGLGSGVMAGVRGAVNGIISILNAGIRQFNKIPLVPNIPEIPKIGAGIGKIETKVPGALTPHGFAEGGLVKGPVMGVVGEAGPELIVPLSRVNQMGLGQSPVVVNVTVESGFVGSVEELGEGLMEVLATQFRSQGVPNWERLARQ